MVDYADLSRRQMIKGVAAWLKRIDPDEDVLLTEHQVRGILDILSYVFKLEGEHRELVWSDLRDLLLVITPKLNWAGHREDEWIRFLEQGIELAHELEDKQTAGVLGIELGALYEGLGNFKDAENIYTDCLRIFERLSDDKNRIRSLAKSAYTQRLRENFEEASRKVKEAFDISEMQASEEAYLCMIKGGLALDRNDYQCAIKDFEHSLRIQKRLNGQRTTAIALNNLGVALYGNKQYQLAIDHLSQSLHIYKKIKDSLQEAITLMNLGCIYSDMNELQLALDFYGASELIFRRAQEKRRLGLLCNNKGWAYYQLNKFSEAEHEYKIGITIWKELSVPKELVNTMDGLGLVYIAQNRQTQAIDIFQKCKKEIEPFRSMPEYQNLYKEIIEHLNQAKHLAFNTDF